MSITYMASDYHSVKDVVLRELLQGSAHKVNVWAWNGVGATALLREVAGEVESEKREFDTVIKVVRPAPFQNRREIQRVVAKQLNLPPSVMTEFDAKDEDDDFKGVEFSSGDLLEGVSKQIYQAVEGHSVLLVLCNNLADPQLLDPYDLGIPIAMGNRNAFLWTSGMNISSERRSVSVDFYFTIAPSSEADALDVLYKEVVEIVRYIDESSSGSLQTTPELVLRCFWYCLLLCITFNRSEELLDDWPLEAAAKYFVCDGILQGDAAWEIGKALAPVIGPLVKYQLQYWGKTFSTLRPRAARHDLLPPKTLLIDSITQGDWVKSSSSSSSSSEKSYRWISVRSPQNNNPEPWDFLKGYPSSVLCDVSSFFGHFEETHKAALPNGFFDHFSNVRVLDLLGCVVSPIDSSFLRLRNLRMLRLEQCKVTSLDPNSHSSAPEGRREPTLLDKLWVLNLYNSDANTFLLAGKAFELMPNLLELDLKEEDTSLLHPIAPNELRELMHKLEVLKLSGNINTKFLQSCLSMEINLKELILNNCEGLVSLDFNLPATIETISLQRCALLEKVELVDPAAASLPNLNTFHLSGSKLIAKLSLQGCRKLESIDLQKLMGLEVLNLSCTAIKVVDISKLPQLKQLFLLGCEQLRRVDGLFQGSKLDVLYLDNYNSGSACSVDQCLDSFRNQRLGEFTKGANDADQRLFHAHVVVKDIRLFRSLHYAFPNLSISKAHSHIHIKGSSTVKRGINIGTTTKLNAATTSASCYVDVLNTITVHCRQHHPSPPARPLNNHIEFDGVDNSQIVEKPLFWNIMEFANSLFVHDSTSNFLLEFEFKNLKCLRIERCPNVEFFFFRYWRENVVLLELESIWLSQLPRLKTLLEQKSIRIGQLKHIYLEFCARLEYVFSTSSELHNLETINIRYCNDLTAIFKSDDDNEEKRGAAPKLLPKLRSIHLQELPKLQYIYKPNITAPSLEELELRGCFNLKKLPRFGRSVRISCEKDWWDKLQWDGLESNHHSSLFNPKHCRYYKKSMKARLL